MNTTVHGIRTLDLATLKPGESLIIGRGDSCDIVIHDPGISAEHLAITIDRNGARIRDLQSRHGVRVNGKPVSGTGRLKHLDHLELCGHLFRVLLPGSPDSVQRVALALDHVTVKGARDVSILKDVSLSLESGEFLGVVGPSGCGKSTLANVAAGLLKPHSGQVMIDGSPVEMSALRQHVAYLPQAVVVHEKLSPEESLHYAARLFPGAGNPQNALLHAGLLERASLEIASLSGGQRKRAALAQELLFSPPILCLDEVTSGLDPLSEQEMMMLFRSLRDQGRGLLCITHYPERLVLCDKLAVLQDGELIFHGSPADTMKHFNISSLEQLYAKIREKTPEEWKRQFHPEIISPVTRSNSITAPLKSFGVLKQFPPLISRGLRIWQRSPGELLFMLIQGVLIGLLVGCCFGSPVAESAKEALRSVQIVFALVLAAIWIGATAAVREIVKERRVIEHEKRRGLSAVALMGSKLLTLGLLSSCNTALAMFCAAALTGMRGDWTWLLWTLCLTTLVSCSMGLLVSAAAASQEKALTVLPVAIIALAMFSGGIYELKSPVASLGRNLSFSSWSFEAAKHGIDPVVLNARRRLPPGVAVADSRVIPEPKPAAASLLYCGAYGLLFFSAGAILLKRRRNL